MPFVQNATDTIFAFADGLLRGTQWYLDLAVCQDPCCPCLACETTWSPVVATETADISHRFWLDLNQRDLKLLPADEHAAFADEFLLHATTADWIALRNLFRQAKRRVYEKIDLTTMDAKFPFAEIEGDGILIGYNEIFPFHHPLRPTLNGRSFLIFDQYCLRPACDCQQMTLNFYTDDPPGPNGESTASPSFTVEMDLARREWELQEQLAPTSAPVLVLMAEFLAQIDAYPLLAERRRVLRALYRHNCGKFVPEPVKVTAKPGRNDPCPCGSGRKYKKCCWGK